MIVDLIAMGHINDLLAVIREMLFRCHDSIGDDVIKEIGTGGTGESEIVDQNRCRSQRTDFQSVAGDMTHKIDEDIDLIGVNTLGCIGKTQMSQINELPTQNHAVWAKRLF